MVQNLSIESLYPTETSTTTKIVKPSRLHDDIAYFKCPLIPEVFLTTWIVPIQFPKGFVLLAFPRALLKGQLL